MMKNLILHLRKILRHKYWVWRYSCKLGIGWQGFWHDMSKFSVSELVESVRYYQGNSSPIPVAKEINGYSEAWQHHKGHNKHHMEYWCDFQRGKLVRIPIPYKYILEMIADWFAAGRVYKNNPNHSYSDQMTWWSINAERIKKTTHPCTFQMICIILNRMDNYSTLSESFGAIREQREELEQVYSELLFLNLLYPRAE